MKVVVDTNVWISALLWGGVPVKILRLARNQTITIYASEALLQEIETSLNKQKLQQRLQHRGYTVEYLIAVVQALSEYCPTTFLATPQLRDPNDAKILAAAAAINADALITGDQDLLILQEFLGIPILTPQNFLNHYFPEL